MSAELAARRTAAAAVLGDFRRAADEFINDITRKVPQPDYSLWAFRLASELTSVLQRIDAAQGWELSPTLGGDQAVSRIAEARAVLAFDWERDDRQYAFEQISRIVNGDNS